MSADNSPPEEPDTAPLTARQMLLASPKTLAVVVFFYMLFALFQVCLVSIIRINAATIGDFAFHCRAMELLYRIRALLNFRKIG